MTKLLDRYVLREVVPPFVVGLLLVVFALLMNQVLLLTELFIDKGVPAGESLRILGLLVPSILVFGLCGFLLTLPLALIVAPRANSAWVRAMAGSVVGRVQLKVRPLEFNETLPHTVFLVREAGRDDRWRDVFAYLTDDPANPRLVLARSGTVRLFPEERRAILALEDGIVYAGPAADPEKDTVTTFARLEEEIDVEDLFPRLSGAKRVREKDIFELTRDLAAMGTVAPALRDTRQVRAHWIEVHKKFALPAAGLVLALLGLPLGLMTGRAGRTGGFSLGLVVILVYYALLTAGEKLAMDGRLPPWLGMWGPDILLAAAAVGLALSAGRPRPAARAPAAIAPARPSSPASAARSRPLRFPGLLDLYVSRKFLGLLALALAALTAAAFLLVFFEHLGETLAAGKPLGLLARHVGFKLPGFLAYLLPAAVLTAALLALGFLARTNEATAMKAAGISAYRSALPVLVLAAAASFLAFAVQERIVPAAEARAEAAWNAVNGRPSRTFGYVNRHWTLGRDAGRVYHYDYLDPGSGAIGRLSVFDIDAGRWRLTRRFQADRAVLEDGAISFRDGWTRDFAAAAGPSFVRAASGRIPADGGESAFLAPAREPAQMTLSELGRYAAEVRRLGFPAGRLRAEWAQKSALPFVSLVMALLAVPFGFRMGRRGTLVGIGLSVAVAMAYWGTFAVFRSLGLTGTLTPFLGAWGANLLFGLAGIVGVFRLKT